MVTCHKISNKKKQKKKNKKKTQTSLAKYYWDQHELAKYCLPTTDYFLYKYTHTLK